MAPAHRVSTRPTDWSTQMTGKRLKASQYPVLDASVKVNKNAYSLLHKPVILMKQNLIPIYTYIDKYIYFHIQKETIPIRVMIY